MKLNNFTLIINQSLYQVLKKIRKIYLNSTIYDKRISSKSLKALTYKPSLKILGSIAKYEKKALAYMNISSFHPQAVQLFIPQWAAHGHHAFIRNVRYFKFDVPNFQFYSIWEHHTQELSDSCQF